MRTVRRRCQRAPTASPWALPALLLGVLPGLIAGITGSGWLMAYGALMLAMASGDLLVLWLIRDVPSGRLVRDHPSEVGCEIQLAAVS